MSDRSMSVTHFYEHRGEVIDYVLRGAGSIVLTRYGRAVAILAPPKKYFLNTLPKEKEVSA